MKTEKILSLGERWDTLRGVIESDPNTKFDFELIRKIFFVGVSVSLANIHELILKRDDPEVIITTMAMWAVECTLELGGELYKPDKSQVN